MILILNRILIFAQTFRSDTKSGGYPYYIKNNFSNKFHSEILILIVILIVILKKKSEKSLRNTTKFDEYH